jgi:hypothetical protein
MKIVKLPKLNLYFKLIFLIGSFLFISSCISEPNLCNTSSYDKVGYYYPYGTESQGATAEITIQVNSDADLESVEAEIPSLKYNKSWLFMLTQDDCEQSAYCYSFAAINDMPISNQYYYNLKQLEYGDLPPDTVSFGKTLGCTDGAGNDVRFAITTTLASEDNNMNAKVTVFPGYTKNYYRFCMMSSLIWDNVKEMLNYGTGIAFHDVGTDSVFDIDSIYKHYVIAQDSILKRLSGRGCKMLAEPNGNKTYVHAAMNYAPIQTMTAQAGAVELYPFKVKDDLQKTLLERVFYSSDEAKAAVISNLQKPEEERSYIHVGVHGTDMGWCKFLLWLNDTYGKNGDDSVWFPSLEEYYEYNYYRIHGSIQKSIDVSKRTIKLIVSLPSNQYFYYPSITINLKGIKKSNIVSVSSSDSVTGLSYGNYSGGLMLNLNCRNALLTNATHYVEEYEADKTSARKRTDAIYFVKMLKESDQKTNLLKRLPQ